MDDIKKHCDKLKKAIDVKLDKEKGAEILSEFDYLTGNETPQEMGRWASDVCSHLECTINADEFVFDDKTCHVDIVETFATGGNDCVFSTWFTDK